MDPRHAHPTSGPTTFVDVDGVILHARVDEPTPPSAPGSPALVFVHSLGTELRIWDDVVARLPANRRVRVDLRGHGLSDAPPGDYALATLASDVLRVLDRLGVTEAVWVGVSIGGQVALQAALDAPERVAGLVLLDTAARIGDREAWEARRAEVRAEGLAASADAVVGRWFAPASRDPLAFRGYRNLLLRTPAAGYLGACAALRNADLRDRTAGIAAPALVLCGSEDAATPPALVRGLADALPDARYVEIAGAGHLPSLDRPDEVAAHVAAFLRRLAAR
ncbi:MAG: 3-oxoadipate enol-lactonase [Trueperaceae bacterium]|nr:3-oxoadipate enol-lactonase [Trueperaceae bacterium]